MIKPYEFVPGDCSTKHELLREICKALEVISNQLAEAGQTIEGPTTVTIRGDILRLLADLDTTPGNAE